MPTVPYSSQTTAKTTPIITLNKNPTYVIKQGLMKNKYSNSTVMVWVIISMRFFNLKISLQKKISC